MTTLCVHGEVNMSGILSFLLITVKKLLRTNCGSTGTSYEQPEIEAGMADESEKQRGELSHLVRILNLLVQSTRTRYSLLVFSILN
jgi:hypothetical protein